MGRSFAFGGRRREVVLMVCVQNKFSAISDAIVLVETHPLTVERLAAEMVLAEVQINDITR